MSSNKKQRYESNADVQRWLQREIIADNDTIQLDADDLRPGFDPGFLAEHHERDWLLSSLQVFYDRHLIDDLLGVGRSGKEATVYCCVANAATGYALLAAKTYRPRMFRSLKNDKVYRESRALRSGDGTIARSKRAKRFVSSNSERGRIERVGAWIHHEYTTQMAAYEAGVRVPAVLSKAGNAILMEWIGDEYGPAPILKHVQLTQQQAQTLLNNILAQIRLMLRIHVIHGDLSEYNILYWNEQAVIIDLAQAVDPRYNMDVYDLLERDIDRVCRFCARWGARADPAALAAELWSEYVFGTYAE